MITITFNAFSFLQKKFKEMDLPYINAKLKITSETTIDQLVDSFNLEKGDVEAVLVNGKVAPFDTQLKDNDRVAFIPHGTPGPYRVLLGFYNEQKA